MSISFRTEAQKLAYTKVGCFLADLKQNYTLVDGAPSYRLQYESASVLVSAVPNGDEDSLVMIVSRVVQGARVDDPELTSFLLSKNMPGVVGSFSIDAQGDIYLSHVLRGSSCSAFQLDASVGAVLTTADTYDDEICTRWGGQRSVDTPVPGAPNEQVDDPTKRTVYEATGPGLGDGKSFFFLFGYRAGHATDQAWLARELTHIEDDIAVLRGAGYRVVIDPQATKQDLLDALGSKGLGAEGLSPAAIYWSGHGHADGSIQTCDGGTVSPEDIDAAAVDGAMRLMIFSSCYVGHRARSWRKALGGHPLVVGWGRPVTIDRAIEFLSSNADTDNDLDDLIRRYLLAETPIPVESDDEPSLAASVTAAPLAVDVSKRLDLVAQMLGSRAGHEDHVTRIGVPLEGGRGRLVCACVLASTAPYSEGEQLLAVEAEVGELTAVVESRALLAAFRRPGPGRLLLVRGPSEAPLLVVQGFLPLLRSRDQDIASLFYQVGDQADVLAQLIFGGSRR